MSHPTSRSIRRLYWRAIRAGLSAGDAGVSVGVSAHCGKRWLREAGGVPPMPLTLPTTPSRYLELNERIAIYCGLLLGHNYAEIARQLGRSTSTITRELHRHRLDPVRPKAGPMPLGRDGTRRIPKKLNYSPQIAHGRAEAERQRPKTGKLASSPRLREEVQSRLAKRHSPQQIVGRLQADFPDDPEMRVSHETIYRALYIQGKGALSRELTACLRTGRKLRKPRKPPEEATPRCAGVSISQRPPEAADRAVPGHWEGDLIIGAFGRSAVGTIVERRSRFMLLAHLPDNHTASAVADSVTAQLQRLPDQVKAQTLTWDQGIEMANHRRIAMDTNVQIFFCDPASPWQRPTNENHNGLLRQYFPKGTDLSVHSAGYLDFVADELNDRPRKILGFRTPREVFYEQLQVT